jgi:hypothetical protein
MTDVGLVKELGDRLDGEPVDSGDPGQGLGLVGAQVAVRAGLSRSVPRLEDVAVDEDQERSRLGPVREVADERREELAPDPAAADEDDPVSHRRTPLGPETGTSQWRGGGCPGELAALAIASSSPADSVLRSRPSLNPCRCIRSFALRRGAARFPGAVVAVKIMPLDELAGLQLKPDAVDDDRGCVAEPSSSKSPTTMWSPSSPPVVLVDRARSQRRRGCIVRRADPAGTSPAARSN